MNLNELDYSEKNVAYHRTLNPAAWSGWRMLPEVRKQLLLIAALFIEQLDMPDFEIEDIRLTGSMCNFNWTQYSDFDLHIVTDYSALDCDDIAEELYHAKKSLWNDRHDITINGHDVELYIEDSRTPPHSQGMFSVVNNQWITKPEYLDPHYDHAAVNTKVKMLIDYLQKTIHSADSTADFERAIDKIYRMRQSGLDRGGEFSTENLAFKVLRNMGWIDRLRTAQTRFTDSRYSL